MIEHDTLIGSPFEYGGRGPDVFDCYGLLRELHFRMTGVWMRDFKSPHDQDAIAKSMAAAIHLWKPIEEQLGRYYVTAGAGRNKGKKFGAPVGGHVMFNVMNIGSHVGFIIEPNKFMHTWDHGDLGACVERLDEWQHRIVGVYEYAGD